MRRQQVAPGRTSGFPHSWENQGDKTEESTDQSFFLWEALLHNLGKLF